MTLIEKHRTKISRLCQNHKVKSLEAFGSALNSDFNTESDLDLIVDFEPMEHDQYADNYYDLKFSLENLFQRAVDLLEEKAITNPYFLKSIEKQRKSIYG